MADTNSYRRRRQPVKPKVSPAGSGRQAKRGLAAVWGRLGAIRNRLWAWLNQPLAGWSAPAGQSGLAAQLTKSRSLLPAYVRLSWAELKCVSWPGFGVAMRLTWAVFVFSVVFAVLVSGVDWVLTRIFQALIFR